MMRIDYQHKRLWLRRVDEEPLTWYGLPWASARRVGVLAAVADEGIWVESVLPDTPAARLGLQPGDQIQFHGEGDTRTKLDALLGRIERGERVTVIREEEGEVLGERGARRRAGARQVTLAGHARQLSTSPPPPIMAEPGMSRSRHGSSRSAANAGEVGPPDQGGMIAGS